MAPQTAARDAVSLLRRQGPTLFPGILLAALFVDWAVQDGGYDPSTWYWGALLALSALATLLAGPKRWRARLSRHQRLAIAGFVLYLAWSYLSISWAQSPGDALQGSNRALLYLILFAFAALLPWTPGAALATLTAFVAGVGILALVLLVRVAAGDAVANLIVNGRLEAPTGYFNSTAALFTITALVAIELAARRQLVPPLRGLLLGIAAGSLQLAVTAESRGWLFTLPLAALFALATVKDRARFILAAALPVAAAVVPVHRLLGIYDARATLAGLTDAAERAGHLALLTSGAVVVLATVLAAADSRKRAPRWVAQRRSEIAAGLIALGLLAGVGGAFAATNGHPVPFITRQWRGFSHVEQASNAASRFEVVGSGRYDFWRVALDAFRSHPLEGLGQDNYADYYVVRRRTTEEPAWPHSLELRLLAMTGIVGLMTFAVFAIAAVAAGLARRRSSGTSGWVAAAAMLPFVAWLIHGSIDWFWEMPSLAGPALTFLAMAGSTRAAAAPARAAAATWRRPRPPAPITTAAGILAFLAATVVLAFPYLSVVEQSRAAREQANPARALSDLTTAAALNPLSALPGRQAGELALQTQQYEVAQRRFRQSIAREPGGWFAWFGAGLAASELGEVASARHDFQVAVAINDQQPAITTALARVDTATPLTAAQGLQMLIVVQ